MLPYGLDQINIAEGTTFPSSVKPYNNYAFTYWCRSLIQRLASVIDANVPWQGNVKNFLMFCLFRWGYVGVFDLPDYGFSFQPCNISGYNFYYQPTTLTVTNPAFKESREFTVGDDAEILQLTPDYMGLLDIIYYYAEKLAGMDTSINTAIINSKIAWIVGASSKSSAQALKKAMDLINHGDPAVIYDRKKLLSSTPTQDEPWKLIDFDVKGSYILSDLLQDFQTVINAFDAEIGIQTLPYQKKERMVTKEANIKVFDSRARAETWIECLNSSSEIINNTFGVNLHFELRYFEEEQPEEVVDNGNS